MFDCNCLIHPFQNDPGTSQSGRVMEDLLSGAAKIDARELADLLDYFIQMSRHINFYDTQLIVSDWQPFFQKSIPFTLASVIKTPTEEIEQNFAHYNSLFEKKPSSTGLQLHAYFIYYRFIKKINEWYSSVKDSGLPIESFLQILIKDKLQQPLKLFIGYTNAAVKWYGIKKIDFTKLDAVAWDLDIADLYAIDNSFQTGTFSKFQRINNLYKNFITVSAPFFGSVKLICVEAEKNLEPSLLPLKEELQKKHPPHLGLLFAFLNIFRQLQDDLNGYTRKHLDFFYKDVLKIKSQDAIADKTHVIFEIQKQLEKYLLKKGLLVKDGKDLNKQQILFSLDDDIVVNETEIADVRTLYLNNTIDPDAKKEGENVLLLEGLYMAPDATKADGIDKDFDSDVKNFYTLGNKESKYANPETKIIKPYPNARLGFILASPVLLLNEGTRTVTITLNCSLDEKICEELSNLINPVSQNCCDENDPEQIITPAYKYPDFLSLSKIYSSVTSALEIEYYYVSETLIGEAIKKGLDSKTAHILRTFLISSNENVTPKEYCYCPTEVRKFDTIVMSKDLQRESIDTSSEIFSTFFKKRKPFQILFSGEKDWIDPDNSTLTSVEIDPYNFNNLFSFIIKTTINPDKPSVTFYDKEKLKEDFNTNLPLVKIELDDHFKILHKYDNQENKCCLDKDFKFENDKIPLSLYHFFRNVKIEKGSKIEVQVCGLKNFIVQNDESLQDVNGPVYPFGTRPVVNPILCVTNDFITDAVGISNKAKTYLQSLLTSSNGLKKTLSKNSLESFLNKRDSSNNPVFTDLDKAALKSLFNNATKNYCLLDQPGPDFYIGSQEVFGKKWNSVRINVNWKDKPADFRDYYNAYVVEDVDQQIFGLDEDKFKIKLSVLQNGHWVAAADNKKLFDSVPLPPIPSLCLPDGSYAQGILLNAADFAGQVNQPITLTDSENDAYKSDSKNGFIKLTLQDQDFLHKEYGYVLARQMMALGKYPDQLLEGAVYRKNGATVIVFRNFGNIIRILEDSILQMKTHSDIAETMAKNLYNEFNIDADYNPLPAPVPPNLPPSTPPPLSDSISDPERNDLYYSIYTVLKEALTTNNSAQAVINNYDLLKNIYSLLDPSGTKVVEPLEVLIPNEPWTPIISNMSLDYTSSATLEDIGLIHLYPYAGTYKAEEIQLQPTLFPTFCDEGTLFLGLKNLVPGNNLNLLFQLAEATSDSESEKQEVQWHYLDNNTWKPLRKGFEMLDDASENLTTSGILKLALPANMTNDNTIMPKGLHWIKASIPQNSKAVSETTGIYPQAISVTFTNDEANDKLRLSQPLPAESISKLNISDANVKSVQQPYNSFGGKVPEIEQQFYVRVSEHLRHKGRAIQKFDYERLVLQEFPQLFKAKCINHSFALDAHLYKNDFPYAPGYVILAVIPDLNKLQAGNSFEPKVPVSIIEKIDTFIRKRTSPFVRFRTMNPRYEKINFCLRINLLPGKDENYYKEQLKEDLKELLAPWAVGKYDKLTFGQCIYRSDIIRFLENTDYVDFITDFKMSKATNPAAINTGPPMSKICPDTPRSILIAGDIDICINKNGNDHWVTCYDNDGQLKVDCCTKEIIPVSDYYIDKNISVT